MPLPVIANKTLSKENAKLIVSFLTKDQLKDGVIVEFKYIDDNFVPYRLRTDKNKPNGEITLKNTMINIEEDISISMLCQNNKIDILDNICMSSLKIN